MPVAEFKCAKTNKPTLFGFYLCICEGQSIFSIVGYNNKMEWDRPNVIAFTETEPGEIVDALNKEK